METNIDYSNVKICVWILIGLLAVLILLVLSMKKFAGSESWPSAKGTILEIDYSGTGGSSSGYAPKISYEFQHENKTYTSNRYTSGNEIAYGTKEGLVDFITNEMNHVEGGEITVYYSPENPTLSFIYHQGFFAKGGLFVVVISLLLLVDLLFLFKNLKVF
jgi:hypothetical protein